MLSHHTNAVIAIATVCVYTTLSAIPLWLVCVYIFLLDWMEVAREIKVSNSNHVKVLDDVISY